MDAYVKLTRREMENLEWARVRGINNMDLEKVTFLFFDGWDICRMPCSDCNTTAFYKDGIIKCIICEAEVSIE